MESVLTVGLTSEASKFVELLKPPSKELDGGKNVGVTVGAVLPFLRPLLSEAEAGVLSDLSSALLATGRWRSSSTGDSPQQGLAAGPWAALVADSEEINIIGARRGLLVCQSLLLFIGVRNFFATGKLQQKIFGDGLRFFRRLTVDGPADNWLKALLPSSVANLTPTSLGRAAQISRHAVAGDVGSQDVEFIQRLLSEAQASISLNELKPAGQPVHDHPVRPVAPDRPSPPPPASSPDKESSLPPSRPGASPPKLPPRPPPLRVWESKPPKKCVDRARKLGLHTSDVQSNAVTVTGFAPPGLTLEAAEQDVLAGHQVRLDALFFEYSDHHLSKPEIRKAIRRLIGLLVEAAAEVERDAALALILVILTQRSIKQVLGLKIGADAADNRITKEGWLATETPELEHSWRPNPEAGTQDTVDTRVYLRMPLAVRTALSTRQVDSPVFADPATVEAEVAGLSRPIREVHGVLRFNRDKARAALSLAIYGLAEDPRNAQLISGDRLGLSDSPLYYYATTLQSLQHRYWEAISTWWPFSSGECREDFISEDASTRWIGSWLGSRSPEEVQRWVALFQPKSSSQWISVLAKDWSEPLNASTPRTEWGPRVSGRKADLRDALRRLNEVSRCSAAMFLAGIGGRCDRLPEITRRNIDLERQYGIISDKADSAAHYARLVALGSSVSNAIANLLDQYAMLLAAIPENCIPNHEGREFVNRVRKHLAAALSGAGPLFLSFEKGRPRAADGSWVMSPLDELGLPGNAFRHVLASQWVAAGGRVPDLYAQLGHRISTYHPFGINSNEPALDFVRRAGKVVDTLLERQGWQVVRAWQKKGQGVPAVRFRARALIGDLNAMELTLEKAARMSARSPRIARGEIRSRLRREVEKQLKKHREQANYDSILENVGALPDLIRTDPDAMAATVAVEMQKAAERQNLAVSVPVEVRATGETTPMLPPVVGAYSIVSRWRTTVLKDLGRPGMAIQNVALESGGHPAAVTALLAILLFYPLEDRNELRAMLFSIDTLRRIPNRDHYILDLGQVVRWIPEWLALLLQTAAKSPLAIEAQGSTSAQEYQDAFIDRVAAEFFSIQGDDVDVDDVLRLVQIGGRLDMPGYLCASLDGRLLVSDLRRERALRFLDGKVYPGGQGTFLIDRAPGFRGNAKAKSKPSDLDQEITLLLRPTTAMRRRVDAKNIGVGTRASRIREASDVRRELEQSFGKGEVLSSEWSPLKTLLYQYLFELSGSGANTRSGGSLALSTIKDYFGTVRNHLLPRLDCSIDEVEASELLDLCSQVIGERSGHDSESKGRSRALWVFVRLWAELFDEDPFDPADWPWPTETTRGRPAPGGIVSDAEHAAVLQLFDTWIDKDKQSGALELRDRLSSARVAWILIRRLGLRSLSEALMLRCSSFEEFDDFVLLHVRATRWDRLKSSNARRTLPLNFLMEDYELRLVRDWRRKQMALAGTDAANDWFFPRVVADGKFAANHVIRIISTALRWVTGDPLARPHWGRHSVVTLLGIENQLPEQFQSSSISYKVNPAHRRFLSGHGTVHMSTWYDHMRSLMAAACSSPQLSADQVALLSGRLPKTHRAWFSACGIGAEQIERQVRGWLRCPEIAEEPKDEGLPQPPLAADSRQRDYETVARALHLLWHGRPWTQAVAWSEMGVQEQVRLLRAIEDVTAQFRDFQIAERLSVEAREVLQLPPRIAADAPSSADNSDTTDERYIPRLLWCCRALDKHLARDPLKKESFSSVVETLLNRQSYRSRHGALAIVDADEQAALVSLFAMMIDDGAEDAFRLGIVTRDGHSSFAVRARIEEAMARAGFTSNLVDVRAQLDRAAFGSTGAALCVARLLDGGTWEAQRRLLDSLLQVVLVVGQWRSRCEEASV